MISCRAALRLGMVMLFVALAATSIIFLKFGCSRPLFGKISWQKAKAILHDIKRGWISDPPGIPLYTLQGHDKHGLTLYHCIRETNSVEGGVHNPICRNFASLNASVELADA